MIFHHYIIILPILVKAQTSIYDHADIQCVPITIPMCRNMGYNVTAMPNEFLHDTQEEAGLEVHQYWPLVELSCSADLQFFLCASYAPVCVAELKQTLPVCRQVCERARAGCEPLMLANSFSWPKRLDCNRLPEYGDPVRLCMDNKNGVGQETRDSDVPNENHKQRGTNREQTTVCNCTCRSSLPQPPDTIQNRDQCQYKCSARRFSDTESLTALIWMTRWALLCAFCCVVTFITFFLDQSRCPYPQRPVVCMTFCYLLVTVGYLLRAVNVQNEVGACRADQQLYIEAKSPPRSTSQTGIVMESDLLASGDNARIFCILVFLLTFTFRLAGAVWWMLLALCWFASTALKWGNEVIAGHAIFLHSIGWGVPVVFTSTVLAVVTIDAEPLLGVCEINSGENYWRFTMLILPQLICAIIGTVLMSYGFIALSRVRQTVGADKNRLHRLMLRLAVYSVLYVLVLLISAAVDVYEYLNAANRGDTDLISCPCQSTGEMDSGRVMMFRLALLQHAAIITPGAGSFIWTFSAKTTQTWRNFCCHRRPQSTTTAATTAVIVTSPMPSQQWHYQQREHHHKQPNTSMGVGGRYGSRATGSLMTSRTVSEAAATGSSSSVSRSRKMAACHV